MRNMNIESLEINHNFIAFINGEFHKAYKGSLETYIHFEIAPGLHSWIAKSKLEGMGATVIIRSGRH